MSWTRSAVLAASDAWVWEPPGAERIELAGMTVIDYPPWAFLGMVALPHTVAEIGDPATVVADVSRAARDRGRDHVEWSISPSAPPGIADAVVAAGGRQTERLEISAYDMSDAAFAGEVLHGPRVVVVDDEATLRDAESVATAVWGNRPATDERWQQMLAELGRPVAERGGFRVVAYDGDRPITTAGCEIVGPAARLWSGCTLPDARGRGGYQAVVAARLRLAHELGATLGLVQAVDNTSGPILRRLGFTSVGEIGIYDLPV